MHDHLFVVALFHTLGKKAAPLRKFLFKLFDKINRGWVNIIQYPKICGSEVTKQHQVQQLFYN
jgi:hypothetical protein